MVEKKVFPITSIAREKGEWYHRPGQQSKGGANFAAESSVLIFRFYKFEVASRMQENPINVIF
jgi:hypothetical protein